MNLIGIAGATGAGKSALADYLIAEHGYVRIDIGTLIKDEILRHCRKTLIAHLLDQNPALAALHHLDPRWETHLRYVMFHARTVLTRALQQEWGTMRRAEDPDYWVRAWTARLQALGPERVVHDNVRFESEARAVQALGGRLVLIERPGTAPAPMAADDPTERGLTGWIEWDAVVINNGTLEALHGAADAFVLDRSPIRQL